MKIRSATIYGFGKWVDFTINFSDETATCIYGENESGKSTIQKFILFMLFGLPPRQREFYRPKTSGKMGGRLIVQHPEKGEFRVERMDEVKNGAAICYTSDGEAHDEDWLLELLNGMTEKTYESIFSFSALDLTEIRTMKDEDLGDVLLGVGLTGSTSIYSIEKRLDAQIGELFKPTGKKPLMNQQIDSLKRITDSLNQFREVEATYQSKKEAIAASEQELTKLQQELKKENARIFATEKQLHAFPVIQEYQQLKNELVTYPETILFPEQGLERLEKWKETMLPLQSEWKIVTENENNTTDQITSIEHLLHSDMIQQNAEELLSQWPITDSQILELGKIKTAINQGYHHMNEQVERLHLGMQLDNLAALELPFYLEKTWMQLRNDTEQLQLETEQLEQEQHQLKQEKDYILQQMQQLRTALLSDNQVHELRDRVNAFNEYDLMQRLKEDENSGKRVWAKNKKVKYKAATNILMISIGIAILACIGAIITDQGLLYMIMVISTVLGIGQWFMEKRSIEEMDKLFQTNSRQDDTVYVTEEEKMEAEDLLEMHHKNKNELAAFQEQEKFGHIQFIKWDDKKKRNHERQRRLEQQIQSQYETYPFLKGVEIAYWPELHHNLKELLKTNREWKKHVNDADILEEKITVFHQQLEHFMENASINPTSLEGKLDVISKLVKTQRERRNDLEHYRKQLEEMSSKRYELEQKMQTYEAEIARLFKTAGVDTEELFYQQANKSQEKQRLKQNLAKVESQLARILPEETFKQFIHKKASETELEMMYKRSSIAIETMEEELELVRKELADKKAELAAMESSESYSNSLHQYEMEAEQLKKMAKEWAVLKTAKEILSETKRDYRASYLTKVIETTTIYFKELTGNTYQNVYAPTDSSPFQVETTDNIRYTVNELSQGTVDQLYVSLRLAISEIMSAKHGLPFIIDDAFVHFDEVRTKRMIEILNHIASKQQVILFTCKSEIADAASAMDKTVLNHTLHV